jgi:magnesium chelatase subunit D
MAVRFSPGDIREKIRERRIGNFLLFVVDGSGSMGARRCMVETKAAIMGLLLDAYQKRDKVAMVAFRGKDAETVLPLSAGLAEASKILRRALRKEPAILSLVVLMTDGRANAALDGSVPRDEALCAARALGGEFPTARFAVVDTEAPGIVRLELARELAAYFKIGPLRAEDLVSIAKEHRA